LVIEKTKSKTVIGGELGFSTLSKIGEPKINGIDKIVNEGVDYLNTMFPNYKYDDRILNVINDGVGKIVENYKADNKIEIGYYIVDKWKNKSKVEYSTKSENGINKWKLGGALILMQLVKIVAEWELYQSFLAAKTIDSLYNDFISDGKIDKIQTVMKKIHKVRK
jgi:hypothetical protein